MADDSQPSKKRSNHTWTAEEDKALVNCLLEFGLYWKGDNGFRPGFTNHLEKMIQAKIPGCTLKANPHITSRIKLLKKHYTAICKMRGPTGGSRFGWNDKLKMIDVEKEVYNEWVKTHPNAKGLYKKPFPFFDELGSIFGKDVATRQDAKGPEDAVQELEREVVVIDDSGTLGDEDYDLMGDTTQIPFYNPIPDNVAEEGVEHSPASTSVAKRGKKRARSEDAIMVVVAEALKDLTQSYRNINDNIEKLVSCFKHEAEGSNRSMCILDELKKIEVLSAPQRVKVAMIMGKDSNITDIFMQGDYEERVLVVTSLLENSQ